MIILETDPEEIARQSRAIQDKVVARFILDSIRREREIYEKENNQQDDASSRRRFEAACKCLFEE